MNSCIYEGQVRHRRFSPRQHKFSYRLFFLFIDLDEVGHIFKKRWLWSATKPALARFKRSDYLGDKNVPLKTAVLDQVESKTGKRPEGPVRLLTHLRYFGYIFNPVSFYYCYDKTDSYVEFILAEITNTPWGERHTYVLPVRATEKSGSHMKFEFLKNFHISPFMPMHMQYDWRFTTPSELLTVNMKNYQDDKRIFDATLSLQKRPLNGFNCARVLTLFPFMTTKVITGIYWEALKLFLKNTPFYPHPDNAHQPSKGGAKQANQS